MAREFRALLEGVEGSTATYVLVPASIMEAFGGRVRMPVRMTINGIERRTTICNMGFGPALGVPAAVGNAAGVARGKRITASVTAHAQPAYGLDLIGIEAVDGHDAYHLRLRPLSNPDRHNLRDLWVDTKTFDVWKAHFAGKYPALVPYGDSPLVPSDITAYFKPMPPYWIVYGLEWSYDYDGSHLTFATNIGAIVFPNILPDWLFDSGAYGRHEKAKEPDVLFEVLQNAPMPTPSWM